MSMTWELSVTAVCGGAVWWSWGRGKASLHSFQWTEWERQNKPMPTPSPAFPSFPIPLYSMCFAILLLFLTVEHQRRYGLSPAETRSVQKNQVWCWVWQTGSWSKSGEIGSHHWDTLGSHDPFLQCFIQQDNAPGVFDHPGVLWSLGMSPCAKAPRHL